MKKTYTLNFILGLFLTVFAFTVNAQDCPPQEFTDNYFWGNVPGQGDFSNGFGDWTLNTLSSDTSEVWEIAPDGKPVFPNFFGGNFEMVSPTACNGVATFSFAKHQTVDNPDYNSPYFVYNAELISPIIDCSGKQDVTLEFYIAYNRLNEFSSYELSVDGGESWLPAVAMPYEGIVNGEVDNRKIIIPVSEFNDVAEARVKFKATGDFYYISIDDVALYEASDPDLSISAAWATGALCYSTPIDQVIPMPIMADVNNLSSKASPESEMTVSAYTVTDGSLDEKIWESKLSYGEIRGNSEDGWNRVHPDLFTPEAVGTYAFEYVIEDSVNDANPENNRVVVPFEVNDQNAFLKLLPPNDFVPEPNNYLNKNRFGGGMKHSFGNAFYIKNGSNSEVERTLDSVRVGFGPDNDAFTAGKVYLQIYSWVDLDGNGTCNVHADGTDEKTLLGTTDMNITPNTDPAAVADMYMYPETEDGDKIKLEDDTHYLALLTLDAFEGNFYDIYYASSEIRQFYDTPTEYAYDTLGMKMMDGSIGRLGDDVDALQTSDIILIEWGSMFVLPYIGAVPVSTNDINKDLGVKVYPTLAQEVVNVELALNEVSKTVLVELTSMDGRSVLSQSYNNLQSDRLTLDVTSVAPGSYLVTIRTEEGMVSKKVNVIK